jgi:oxygen-independent coproporphyrinogen III oxidase
MDTGKLMDRTKPDRINPAGIPGVLLEKYNTRGPRYTSYPTAPQFKPEFNRDNVVREWKRSNTSDFPDLAFYIHVPFCRRRCLYCGCTTEVHHNQATHSHYVSEVLRELDGISDLIDTQRKIGQLALGGGTPVELNHSDLNHLIGGLNKKYRFRTHAEQSIEIDPRHISVDTLDFLIDIGFNRFSFGIQDLDPSVQRNIHRELDFKKIDILLNHLRKRQCYAINLDLMYGLPGQTAESVADTINKIVTLRPSRIALFGYAHVPWISPHQKALEKFGLPTANERLMLFGTAYDALLDAGYLHIGMDHFALPDDELIKALSNRTLTRNFMGYTTRKGLDLIGLGASAISSAGCTYTQNIKSVAEYLGRSSGSRWWKALVLSNEDVLRRDVILELFCNFHLDIREIEKRYDLSFKSHFSNELEELREFIGDELLFVTEETISVTALGRYFVRNICMTFDQYLKKNNGSGTYSKTI